MRHRSRSRLAIGLFVFAALLFAAAARAVTRTWTGAGSNDNWTTAANWGGTAPSAGDDLVFPGGTPRLTPNNDFPANTSFNSIAFTGATGGYTLVGNAIQLAAGINANNTSGNSTVQLPVALTASQTFACNILGPVDRLTISGTVALGANSLTVDSVSGSIINLNGVISGTGGLSSVGFGIVFVVASMTYTGPTQVNAGDFVLAGSSLSPSSAVTVTGGELQFANNASTGPVNATGGAVACSGGGTSQIGNVTDLTLAAAASLQMAMYSAINYGTLNASGNVDLGGSGLSLGFAFSSSTGDAFTIINKTSGGAVTGTFAGKPEGSTFNVGGRDYQITYAGGDGNDVVVTDITVGGPTPTPTTTVTPTPTATLTPPPGTTPTPAGTPGPGPVAAVPTISDHLLVVLAVALALVALLVIRKS